MSKLSDGWLAIFAFMLINFGLFPGVTTSILVWGGEVVIPGCPDESVEITDWSIASGDTASCEADIDITFGPDINVSARANVSLSAPIVMFNGPVSIAPAAVFSIQTPESAPMLLIKQVRDEILELLTAGVATGDALTQMETRLKARVEVFDALASPDEENLLVYFESGLLYLVQVVPGTADAAAYEWTEAPTLTTGGSSGIPLAPSPQALDGELFGLPGNNKALVVSSNQKCPIEINTGIGDDIEMKLQKMGYQITREKTGDIETFTNLTPYGVVYVEAPGVGLGFHSASVGVDDWTVYSYLHNSLVEYQRVKRGLTKAPEHTFGMHGLNWLTTGTPATTETLLLYADDISWGRVLVKDLIVKISDSTSVPCDPRLSISPNFVLHRNSGQFPDHAVVFMDVGDVFSGEPFIFPDDLVAGYDGLFPENWSLWWAVLNAFKGSSFVETLGWFGSPKSESRTMAVTNFFELSKGADELLDTANGVITREAVVPPAPNNSVGWAMATLEVTGWNLDLETGAKLVQESSLNYWLASENINQLGVTLAPIVGPLFVDNDSQAYFRTSTELPGGGRLKFVNAPAGSNDLDIGVRGDYLPERICGLWRGDYRLNMPVGVDGPFYLASADGRRSPTFTLHTWKPVFSATITRPSEGLNAAFNYSLVGRGMARGRSVAGAAPNGMFVGPYAPEPLEGFWPVCFEENVSNINWSVSGYLNDGYYIYEHEGAGLKPLKTDLYYTSHFVTDWYIPTIFDAGVYPDRDLMDITYTTTSTYIADGSVSTDTYDVPETDIVLEDQPITEQGVIKAGSLAECRGSWDDICSLKWNDAAPVPPYDPDTTRR